VIGVFAFRRVVTNQKESIEMSIRNQHKCRSRKAGSTGMGLLMMLFLFSFVPSFATAQSEERGLKIQQDLKTLLQDSAYLYNRYEEVTTGMDAEIEFWNIPASLKTTLKSELSLVASNLSVEKPKLNAILSKTDVSASDLLDVYSEVMDLANQLSGQSNNFEHLGNDQQKAVELTKLSVKASILAANINTVLSIKVLDLEYELDACKMKASTPTAKPK
jgi:hypothetical protein